MFVFFLYFMSKVGEVQQRGKYKPRDQIQILEGNSGNFTENNSCQKDHGTLFCLCILKTFIKIHILCVGNSIYTLALSLYIVLMQVSHYYYYYFLFNAIFAQKRAQLQDRIFRIIMFGIRITNVKSQQHRIFKMFSH